MCAQILLLLIAVAIGVGVVVWIVRYQPFVPADAIGSPLASAHPAAAGWQPGPEAPFTRLEMATAVFAGRIWMFGGFDPDGSATDAVAILDPATGEWTDGPRLPAAVHRAALAADGDELILMGGYLGSTGAATDAVLRSRSLMGIRSIPAGALCFQA